MSLYFAKIDRRHAVTHDQTGARMHSTTAIAVTISAVTSTATPGGRRQLAKLQAARGAIARWLVCAAACVAGASSANAGLLTHSFSISGDNGETGSGNFVWDDDTVINGAPVSASLSNIGDLLSLNIELSGGNVIGGSTVFTEVDCVGAFLLDSPDFTTDINFFCNNGVNTLAGISENTNFLNDTADFGAGLIPPVLGPSSSTLSLSPGQTLPVQTNRAATVPASPWWSLLGLGLFMTILGRRAIAGTLKAV